MQTSTIWPIVATVAALFMALVGGLVILNLQSLKKCITDLSDKQKRQEDKIDRLVERKNICNQDYVNKVDYIRAVNSLEGTMKQMLEKVSQVSGQMKFVEQLPQIMGNITREIVKEMKHDRQSDPH